ncbi:MAG: glycosyltransferase family 2 protein [Candidatus Riflebacteria bacterium]|nr:glycosyltransferase family 2 protein [Candidatus Riflebacteria bacterium]
MKVTVGVPLLNVSATVLDAVRSVFAQTFEDWELLLVDDGSSDGTPDLVRGVHDSRVRVLTDGLHRGLVPRLNQIILAARGSFIARMDADDLMHPERLAKQVAFLEGNPGIDLVSSGIFSIGSRNELHGIRALEDDEPDLPTIFRQGGIIHPCVVTRREWSRRHLYDPGFPRAEDRELWVRTYSNSRFAKLPEPLYFYREVGQFNLRKFLASYQTERKILKTHGPSLLGKSAMGMLLWRLRAKGLAVRLLHALGAGNLLMVSRCEPASELQREDFEDALKKIRQTRLPGIDS